MMDLNKLNPFVRTVSIYEKVPKSDVCIAYDSRILYVISGDLSVSAGAEKFAHLTAGNVVFIPSGVPYKLKGNYVRFCVATFDLTSDYSDEKDRLSPCVPDEYNCELLHSNEGMEPFDSVLHIDDFEGERDNFIRLSNIYTSAEGNYFAELSANIKLILLKIAETADENALPSRMVENLGNYIRENVSDEISNTEIGAIFGYHPFYVSRMLKEKKGQTLRQYIISYRFKLAKRMLELTNKTVNEIAEECGFKDASYFTKSFKASAGMTPKEYRNKFKDEFI